MAKKYRRVNDSSETYQKVDPMKVAQGLGADAVEPLDQKGFEIVFNGPLERYGSSEGLLSPGGELFWFKHLAGYDIKNRKIILLEGCRVFKELSTEIFVFEHLGSHRSYLSERSIFSIKDLSQNKLLYADGTVQ